MRNISTTDDYPPSPPADVERPVHLDGSVSGPAIVGNNNPVCIDDESEVNKGRNIGALISNWTSFLMLFWHDSSSIGLRNVSQERIAGYD